jgi:DNA-directed RNA polymerase subunit RPC12/RpoP
MSEPSPEIVCVDCGGRAFLLTHPPADGAWAVGDIVAYRCEDCRDRWDLVLVAADLGVEQE